MSNIPSSRPGGGPRIADMRARWGWFVARGVALLVIGFIAFIDLFAATLASIYYIGAMMLVGGIVQIAHAFHVRTWGNFWFWLISGVLYALAGIAFFVNPLLASAFLTLLLGIGLVIAGVFRSWAGFEARPAPGWGWILATGLITLLTGIVIIIHWPVNSLFILGMLLAIDLGFQGWAFIAFGFMLKPKA